MSDPQQTLAQLAHGVEAIVDSIEGDDLISNRLLEMGLTPGIKTTVIGSAFSGDPIEIRVRQYRLTLRLAEARRVWVRSISTDK